MSSALAKQQGRSRDKRSGLLTAEVPGGSSRDVGASGPD
jgi:hypothetical protein